MFDFLSEHLKQVTGSAVFFGIALICSLVEHHFYKKVYPKICVKKHTWLLALFKALHAPLQIFIWFFGLSLAIDAWINFFQNPSVMIVYNPARMAIGIVLIIWFFSGFVTEVERRLMKKEEGSGRVDKMTVRAIGQLLRALFIFAGIILILQSVFLVPISGIVALAGGGGLTIGFAAKDLLANFFGGLMILLDRPFALGNQITILKKEIEGIVEEIGWRMTVVRVSNEETVHIPNSLFLNCLVKTRKTQKKPAS